MSNYFTDANLSANPPIKRAAYSDRTAWILAEISRLVYEDLPGEIAVDKLVSNIIKSVQNQESTSSIESLIKLAIHKERKVESIIADTLNGAGFELLEGFAIDGTEAILAQLPPQPNKSFEGMLILAFRGTQITSSKDIFTDMRLNLVSAPDGGRVHAGFLEAFRKVEEPIRKALKHHCGIPLYITGHSQGGALALVATRYLGSDSIGATYTFGCPRAGDDIFFESIKTPVYRVVNATDGVTRIPFGYFLTILLVLIRLIPINGTLGISELIRRKLLGYTHYGDLVFLSAPPNLPDDKNIPFKGLKVVHSPDIFWRSWLVFTRVIATLGRAFLSDHSMREYCLKLLANAQRRNMRNI